MALEHTRSTPTVVVARRPVPGKERETEQMLQRLVAAARQAPGHVHSEVQAPTAAHPGEWVIVYQFADMEALGAWLQSSERAEIMAEGEHLLIGETREQLLALPAHTPAVTAVASFTVKPGSDDRYTELHDRLLRRLASFPGFVRSEVFEPVPGVQDETVVVFSFETREQLDAWLDSDARQAMLDELAPFIEGGRTLNIVGGYGGWFGRPGMERVKRWKQAAVVLMALFPTALGLTALREWLLPDIGLVLGVLIGNVLGVALLTWVLMPALTRLFDSWLRR